MRRDEAMWGREGGAEETSHHLRYEPVQCTFIKLIQRTSESTHSDLTIALLWIANADQQINMK